MIDSLKNISGKKAPSGSGPPILIQYQLEGSFGSPMVTHRHNLYPGYTLMRDPSNPHAVDSAQPFPGKETRP